MTRPTLILRVPLSAPLRLARNAGLMGWRPVSGLTCGCALRRESGLMLYTKAAAAHLDDLNGNRGRASRCQQRRSRPPPPADKGVGPRRPSDPMAEIPAGPLTHKGTLGLHARNDNHGVAFALTGTTIEIVPRRSGRNRIDLRAVAKRRSRRGPFAPAHSLSDLHWASGLVTRTSQA